MRSDSTPGSLDVDWIHGSRSRRRRRDPPLQIHRYRDDTVIMRQSKDVTFEAPFLFQLFGHERALLIDTGAVTDATVRHAVDRLIADWLTSHPHSDYQLVVAHTHGHGDHVAGGHNDDQTTPGRSPGRQNLVAPDSRLGEGVSMSCLVSHTSIDCRNAYQLSEWWKPALGYVDIEGDPNLPGHVECMIQDPDSGHRVLFLEVPEGKQVKNRMHLDLRPRERSRDEEVAWLLEYGATEVADHRGIHGPGSGWVVLADPEGNEFCVLRSRSDSSN